jgi:hypothetical protein
MSILDLPTEVLSVILRKTFVGNMTCMRLENVCKNFKEVMNTFYDRCKKEDFVCKSCVDKSYTFILKFRCNECPYEKCQHSNDCMGPKLILTESTHKICNSCNWLCTKHKPKCMYGIMCIRGILGFCNKCLYNLSKKECVQRGLEIMTTYKGNNTYCIPCLRIFKPKTKELSKVSSDYKDIFPTDEPFCY